MVTSVERRVASRPRAPISGGSPAGYSLVMVIMAVTVLNIMLAAALPAWSEMIKRDKEEELISRGFQYAEAIRVFQKRFQRFPAKLDELILVKPRCIRKLWKDPMTEDGQWEVILLNQGSPIRPPPGTSQGTPEGLNPPNQPKITIGPLVGVRSRSSKHSLLQFFGHDRYDEWEFRLEMLSGRRDPRVPASSLTLSTRWLGRPMPNFVPVGNGIPPGGGAPGSPGTPPGGPGTPRRGAPQPPRGINPP
jgi:type II secretory pathway pseudopilin PulG